MKITIRSAKIDDDFDQVAQIYLQSWLSTYTGLLPSSYLKQLTPTTWQPQKRWQNTFLAFTANNQPIGVVTYGPSRSKTLADHGELYSLYLLPQYQRQGVGKQLFQAASQKLISTYQHNYLWVLSNNTAAQAFYLSQGLRNSSTIRAVHTAGIILNESRYDWPS